MRPEWETVVKSVVDHALTLPQVDPARIALSGWSLGGYLAPRAASGEQRLAACIADPGQADVADGFRSFFVKLGATPKAAARPGEIDRELLDRMTAIVAKDRTLDWAVRRRGFWMNGVDSMRDYLRSVETFTIAGRIEEISCPTLFTLAESDPLASHGMEHLRAQKILRLKRPSGNMHFNPLGAPVLDETLVLHCLLDGRTLQHPVAQGS